MKKIIFLLILVSPFILRAQDGGLNTIKVKSPTIIVESPTDITSTATKLAALDADNKLGYFSKSDLYLIQTSFSSNSSYKGEVLTGTAGENLVFGDFVYFKFSDGKFWKASASAYATARCRGIAVGTINTNSTGNILIRGTVRYDTWNWTAAEVWLSTTAGSGTSTQPSTTGNQIQYLGLAINADVLFFNPSNDIGEK